MNSADTQAAVAGEVQDRMGRAVEELAEKYAAGKGGIETSATAPTGTAYKEKQAEETKRKQAAKAKRIADEGAEGGEDRREDRENRLQQEDGDEGDQDGGDADEDVELRELREARLRQIRQAQRDKIENVGKGHGQYREIVQDEFLAEVCSSDRVVCHFYHRDFPKCLIMDYHIQRLVARHLETKFIKIDAAKTPFFVEKLKVRILPTLVLFFDGVAQDKLVGFDGLADNMPEGKEEEWPTIALARFLGSKNAINKALIVDDDGVEAAMKARMDEMKKSIFAGMRNAPINLIDDDDDFDLDN